MPKKRDRPANAMFTRKYEWDILFAHKGVVRLYRERDYNGLEYTFSQVMRLNAKNRGLKLSIHIGDHYVDYEVVGKLKGKRSKK